MIDLLIKKNDKTLDKLDCYAQCEEIAKKKRVVFALLRDETILSETDEEKSAIPLLCEGYWMLSRLYAQLSKMIIQYSDKARIKIDDGDQFIYEVYFTSLQDCARKLKFEHRILLTAEKNVA
jgi:hypothetical protein